MSALWVCPRCKRAFRRANQRHACGVGDPSALLKNKPPFLVDLYRSIEQTVRSLDGVEIVTRDRYALFRSGRIFADLVFMRDALRLAIHLGRKVSDPIFFKVVAGANGRVTYVAKLRTAAELRAVMPYLKEALQFAQSEA